MVSNNSVLIVEDELITAGSIQELLLDEEYWVIGIAKDAETALQLCSEAAEPPAVVICDINIRGNILGTELAARLKELYHCEIIFLTAYSDSRTLEKAFASDPVMYVVKPYTDTQLLVALQMAFHRMYAKEKAKKQQPIELTSREREIAALVARGCTSRQIARQLFISEETVKTHRRRMLQKNNLSSFTQLVYLMNR